MSNQQYSFTLVSRLTNEKLERSFDTIFNMLDKYNKYYKEYYDFKEVFNDNKLLTPLEFNDLLFNEYSEMFCMYNVVLAGKLAFYKQLPVNNHQLFIENFNIEDGLIDYITKIEVEMDIIQYRHQKSLFVIYNYKNNNNSEGKVENTPVFFTIKNCICYKIIEGIKVKPFDV